MDGISIVTLMGVSGCGKTTIGKILAEKLGCRFCESDDFHSQADIAKMASGIPLTDSDRWPWLRELNTHLVTATQKSEAVILACSALKQTYREVLYRSIPRGVFVYLKGSFPLIQSRMKTRSHFMKAGMLQSQFDDLEEPADALVMNINQPPEKIAEKIIEELNLTTMLAQGYRSTISAMPTEKEVYASHADQYERLILREDHENNLPQAIESIKATRGIDIVEIGAGTGRLTRFLASEANTLTASDLSMHMLSVAQDVIRQQNIDNTLICAADMRATPLAARSADMVIAGWSFCYLAVWGEERWEAELKHGLEEATRLLRPDGVLIALENYGTGFEAPHPPPHLNSYFSFLKENGFQDTWVRTDYAFNDAAEAVELSGFFFGEEMAEKVERNGWTLLPECTGVLWKFI